MSFKNLRSIVLVSFLTCILILTGCGSNTREDSFENIVNKGVVTIGLDDTFVPMGFRDKQGEIVGFDVDLANEVFDRIGLKVKFQQIDWVMKETELNSGNIDLIWNGYTITKERSEKVLFTKPYLSNSQVVVVLSDSEINKKDDLNNKIIGVQSASSAYDAVNKEPELVERFQGGEPIEFDTNYDALKDLEAKRIDAVVVDEIVAKYYISKNGSEKYRILEEDFGEEVYGIGARKEDNTLIMEIESVMDEMKEDGTYDGIVEKWFGENNN